MIGGVNTRKVYAASRRRFLMNGVDQVNMDPAAAYVDSGLVQVFVDWLKTGRLHFQLNETNMPPVDLVDPETGAPPQDLIAPGGNVPFEYDRQYAGFLAIPQPSRNVAPALGTPISLVGDGVEITVPPTGWTCSVALTLAAVNAVSLSVSVSNTTTNPPVEIQKNMEYFEAKWGVIGGPLIGNNSGGVAGGWAFEPPGPWWITMLDPNFPRPFFTLTVAEWPSEWFLRSRANLFGGKSVPTGPRPKPG
jgi:hypothetical protein